MESYHWIEGRNNQNISLVTHVPNNEEKNGCTIIYAHGFTGNKIGDNRMGINLARYLCEKGYLVIRFDYIGSGESEGEFAEDTNFSGWIHDFQTVLTWTKQLEQVDDKKIGIVGHSFSGAVVTEIGKINDNVSSVCALSPVFKLEESFKEVIIGNELWQQLLAGNTIKDFYNKKYALSPTFAHDLLKYNLSQSAKEVDVPFLIIQGKKDRVLPYHHSEQLLEEIKSETKELMIMDEEEHLFSTKIHKPLLDWFTKTLQ